MTTFNSLVNFATNVGRTTVPDYKKKSNKVNNILRNIRDSTGNIKKYKVNHNSKNYNLETLRAIEDGFSPIGDQSDKFVRTLYKIPYESLRRFNNNPKLWSNDNTELFTMVWNGTPSPKKTVVSKNTDGYLESARKYLFGEKKKSSRSKRKGKTKHKGKKGKTSRRTRRR